MRIIDSQVHIWKDVPASFMEANPGEPPAFTYQTLVTEMEKAGVAAAMLVPRAFSGADNSYVLEAVRAHPDKFAMMGRVPNNAKEGVPLIENWRATPGVIGVRLTFHRDGNRPNITNGSMDWFWPTAEKHQVPAMIHAPERLQEVAKIAERHPDLCIIIDHMGFARATIDKETGPAADRLIALAKYPNVHVKVSTMPAYSTEPYPFLNLRDPIRRTIDAFGIKRCFWGSDVTRIENCSYREAVTMFTDDNGFLSKDEMADFMGNGLARVLGWPKAV